MARTGELHVELAVNYPDDPAIIAAGERAELLYVRSLCLVKRLLSDGFIADAQLPAFRLSGVRARAEKLVEVGLWDRVDGGWRIVGWTKRNRSRAEIEERAEKKRKAAKIGNHQRWHVQENRYDPDCPLCVSQVSQTLADCDSQTSQNLSTANPTETETESSTSSAATRSRDGQGPFMPGTGRLKVINDYRLSS